MTDTKLIAQIATDLKTDWSLTIDSDAPTEAQLLDALEQLVSRIILEGSSAFFGLMYRLDIPELRLRQIMHDKDAPRKIARMIYDRQWQKAESRRQHRNYPTNDDPDMAW